MSRHVVLVTGTPCVGKTSVARSLAHDLDASYLNLTEFALHENLIVDRDEERDSAIVDENLMRLKIREIVEKYNGKDIVIDGHYAVNVVPRELVTHVLVLRRDPVELKQFMQKSGLSGHKLWENLASEILDVCLCDALNIYDVQKICELDVSGKRVEEVVSQVMAILNGAEKCRVGVVDWLGKLESAGLIEEFMKI